MNRGFYYLSVSTLVAVVLVIFAGSIVRTTGSGMGCPDWPRCFGQWIPPTDVSQIPENYKEIYGKKREEKLLNFCRLLEKIGFKKEAEMMRNDPSLLVEQDFNAAKTWTEAVNRYVGFIAGNLMLIQFIVSVFLFRNRKKIVLFSFLNLFLIMFTAWLGAIVVATNLLPWMITLHMSLALIIVAVQVLIIDQVFNGVKIFHRKLKLTLFILLLLLFVQIILGTQVRQQIDRIAEEFFNQREMWIGQLNVLFYIHRTLSLFVLFLAIYIYIMAKKSGLQLQLPKFVLYLIGLEILSGVTLAYLAMPAVAQPVHLLLSSLLLLFIFRYYFSISRIKVN